MSRKSGKSIKPSLQVLDERLTAVLIERPNKYLGIVDLNGRRTEAFIPNPGRMKELLYPGAKIYIQHKKGAGRKTEYDLILVEHRNTLVSIDSRLPNLLTAEAIKEKKINPFRGYKVKKAEYTRGDSRLDFLLEGEKGRVFVEVKSCTLVNSDVALFPDAPTNRGSKHLKNLENCLTEGRAAMLIVVQRSDANVFSPNVVTDEVFSETLRRVSEQGVEVYAYTCKISLDEAKIERKIPIKLV